MKRLLFISILGLFFVCSTALTDSAFVSFSDETPGSLTFTANAGSDQLFTVERWKFSKVENAHDPENILLEAEFDIASISNGWTDMLQSVKKKKDYFHVSKFKVASVKIEGAVANDDGSYSTDAVLTLKGISKEVPLTFTISTEAPYHVEAEGVVKRKKFGFKGKGPKNEVPVKISADLE